MLKQQHAAIKWDQILAYPLAIFYAYLDKITS